MRAVIFEGKRTANKKKKIVFICREKRGCSALRRFSLGLCGSSVEQSCRLASRQLFLLFVIIVDLVAAMFLITGACRGENAFKPTTTKKKSFRSKKGKYDARIVGRYQRENENKFLTNYLMGGGHEKMGRK